MQEEEMNHDATLTSGILLVTVPTIQYGGYFLLRLFSGQMPSLKPSPLSTLRDCYARRSTDHPPNDREWRGPRPNTR
jgi:hypothetical protein